MRTRSRATHATPIIAKEFTKPGLSGSCDTNTALAMRCDNFMVVRRLCNKIQRLRFFAAATVSTAYFISSLASKRLRMSSEKGNLRYSGMSLRFHANR